MSIYNALLNTHVLGISVSSFEEKNHICPHTNYSNLVTNYLYYFYRYNLVYVTNVYISHNDTFPYLMKSSYIHYVEDYIKLINYKSFKLYTSQR